MNVEHLISDYHFSITSVQYIGTSEFNIIIFLFFIISFTIRRFKPRLTTSATDVNFKVFFTVLT